jgi:hypothetical protein
MLKKINHIILILSLLVSTSGISLSMHYCDGELVSFSINKQVKACCDEVGGCCKNKTLHFEIKEDFENPLQVNKTKTVALDILFPILFVLNFELLDEKDIATHSLYDASSPPTMQTHLALLQVYLC